MLNKDICKRCRHEADKGLRDWDKYDEHTWSAAGMVECSFMARHASVDDVPPEVCPYVAEHVVSQNVE